MSMVETLKERREFTMTMPSFSEDENRIDYLDVAKGILIISVVLCHSPFKYYQILYWFHMPAFFMISGMLYKDEMDVKHQFIKFFVPYLSFSIIDVIFAFMITPSNFNKQNIISLLWKHIYSGKAIPGVFWFIPCLFLSKTIFHYLKKNTSTKTLIITMILMYILGHAFSILCMPDDVTKIPEKLMLPWNMDVVLVCVPYYAIGYFLRNYIDIIKSKKTLIISFALCVLFTVLNFALGIYYYLNLKFSQFRFFALDIIVPIIFTVFILSLSYNMKSGKVKSTLCSMGRQSLVIMYLHKPIVLFLLSKIEFGFVAYTLIGVIIPYLIGKYIIDRIDVFQFIFKGKHKVLVSA